MSSIQSYIRVLWIECVTAKVSSIQEPKLTAGDYMLPNVAHRFLYTLFFPRS